MYPARLAATRKSASAESEVETDCSRSALQLAPQCGHFDSAIRRADLRRIRPAAIPEFIDPKTAGRVAVDIFAGNILMLAAISRKAFTVIIHRLRWFHSFFPLGGLPMRIESRTYLHGSPSLSTHEITPKAPRAVAASPELMARLDTIIKPRDKRNGVSETELYAGVAYDRVAKYAGADVADSFRNVIERARKDGKSLYAATQKALKTMRTTFARTIYAGDADADKKAQNLRHRIADEARHGSALNGNTSVSHKTSMGWKKAYGAAAGNLADVDARRGG